MSTERPGLLRRLTLWRPLNAALTSVARAGGRRLPTPPRRLPQRLPRAGPVAVRVPGLGELSLESRGDDWLANHLYWRGWGSFEPLTTKRFVELARDARVVVDVGAHVGLYSLLASLANPAARVFAFEPHHAVHERLLANVRSNRARNITCVQAAAAASDGVAELFLLDGWQLPSSSSLDREFMAVHANVTGRAVRTLRLDSFCEQSGIEGVQLVKVDVEAAELDVLSGMRSILQRDRPRIICEILGDPGPVIEMLAPLGYASELLDRGNYLFSADA